MRQTTWTYWVYLIQDGERYGFLIGKRRNADEPIRYEYFYPDGPRGLSPDGACLQFLPGDAVHPPDPSAEVTKFLALLKTCVLHANQGDSLSRCIACKDIRGLGDDPAATFRRLFDFNDKPNGILRHDRSPLRKFFVSYDKGFTTSVLHLSQRCFQVTAEAFEPLTPEDIEERVFDTTALFQSIKEFLCEDSSQHLRHQLRTDNISDYIPLELEIGHMPQEEGLSQRMRQVPSEMGREWHPFNVDYFLLPGKRFLLTSVSGSGKTTFLRHTQYKMLSSSDRLVAFFRAKDLQPLRPICWPRIRTLLVEHFDSLARPAILRTFLDGVWNNGRLVLLVDAMDNLGTAGANCHDLVSDLVAATGANTLIMAGRPTVIGLLPNGEDVDLLRLRPYSEESCQEYFGDLYDGACTLCRGNTQLLTTPLYAYMLKTLCAKRPDKIASLWDLYSAFLKHILHEHPTNIQDINHRQWAHDMRDSLGAISFHAIDRHDPEWVTVSESTVHAALQSTPRSARVPIDALPSAGLADLVDLNGARTDASLAFSHQSFQEFMAADWISHDDGNIEHVLQEYWNPKWKEVIRFLCGCDEGPSILSQLYSNAQSDNPLHARLFFAAECAKELSEHPELQLTLYAELEHLLTDPIFAPECLVGLSHLTIHDAKELLWSIYRDGQYRRSYDIRQLKAIESVYRSDRLDHILHSDRMFANNNLWLLVAWGRYLSERQIDVVIDLLASQPSISLKLQALFPRISRQLSRRQLDTLLAICTPPRKVAWHVLRGLYACFSKNDITRIIETACAMYHPSRSEYNYYILRRLAECPQLQKCHIDQVLNRFLGSEDVLEQQELAVVLKSVNRWLAASDISALVAAIREKNHAARHLAIEVLEGILHCARPDEQKVLIALLDDSDAMVCRKAAITVASLKERLSKPLRRKLLEAIKVSMSDVAADIWIGCPIVSYLGKSLTRADVEYFIDQALRTTKRVAKLNALEVCGRVIHLLSESEIAQLLSRFLESAQGEAKFLLPETQAAYKKRLDSKQVTMVVDRIMKANRSERILELLGLVNEEAITSHDAKRLSGLINNKKDSVREAIYWKLTGIHAKRGLLDGMLA